MADKNWTTGFPVNLDSNTNMPSLAPGDSGLITQPNALKDAIIQIENVLGSNSLETGSVRQKIGDLEANGATKDLLDSYAKLLNWPGSQALLDSYVVLSSWPGDQALLDSYAKLSNWPGSQVLLDSYAVLSHHLRHEVGGGDEIKLDNLDTPDDNTDLNATTGYHGLLPKLSGISTEFLNGSGLWAVPAGGGGGSGLVDGYLPLPELVINPSSNDNYGHLYSKLVDGYSELHYQDDYGLVTKLTDKGTTTSGVIYDRSYEINNWYSGSRPAYNPQTRLMEIGFIDEFAGPALDSRWTQALGTDGSITASTGLRLQDGASGTDIVFIHTPVQQAFGFEYQFHLTRNSSNNSTNCYVGLYANNVTPGGSIPAYYVGHNRDAGGTRTIIFGEGTSSRTAASSVDAIWLRMIVNSYGYSAWYNTALAETSEPGVSDWSLVAAGIQALVQPFKPTYFICASNAFGANASDYTIRHIKFRYI
jgi:hypothetical protein